MTATVNGQAMSVDTTFVADVSTARLSVEAAAGSTYNKINVQVRLVDAYDNPIRGHSVGLHATFGNLGDMELVTGADGKAMTNVLSNIAGSSTVTAYSMLTPRVSTVIRFIADEGSATITWGSPVLNGNSGKVLVAVKDRHGNPLINYAVNFYGHKIEFGPLFFSPHIVKRTDANGHILLEFQAANVWAWPPDWLDSSISSTLWISNRPLGSINITN
ncbi:hypothetical protein EMIT0324P_280005 [Pseudomonas chlororaphis]